MRYASSDFNWNVIRRWIPFRITDVELFFIPIIVEVAEQDFGVNVFAKAGSGLFDNIWTSCVSWAGTKFKAKTEDMAIEFRRSVTGTKVVTGDILRTRREDKKACSKQHIR